MAIFSPNTIVFFCWSSIWSVFLSLALLRPEVKGRPSICHVAASVVALVWIGMVSGVSFLEAWVKFSAPLLTKQVGVDVGRTVFAALNSAETAHALALSSALALDIFLFNPVDLTRAPFETFLFLLPLLILGLQIAWLTPSLDLLARYVVREAEVSDVPSSRLGQQLNVGEVPTKGKRPPSWLHGLYPILEAVKTGGLVWVAFSGLSRCVGL